jgi:transposase
MVLEGAMDGSAFVAWLHSFLMPTLGAGQVVVMDNLNVHKGAQVRQIIEGAGCELIYLPAYSPDLTPIEGAYSKVKARLRRAGKRTQHELEGAIGEAVEAVTADDARGWFAHCGYRLPGHLSRNPL